MARKTSPKRTGASGVDEYIANAPPEVQGKLREIRATIFAAAPGATERTDYFQMPGYSYEGYDYDGMFVWFSFKKPYIRLHLRPPVIHEHKKELARCGTTKAIVSFPPDKAISKMLVKKLVKATLKVMKDKSK
ncbi:MAG: iron chaperone [Terriglobales bacterium]